MEETKNVVTNENFDWNAFEHDLGVYDQPKEEIAAAYDKTLSNVNVGEVVEGTVTAITKREVLVNIGYKSEGVIPVSEFRYNPDLTNVILVLMFLWILAVLIFLPEFPAAASHARSPRWVRRSARRWLRYTPRRCGSRCS